jgi:hypothetical protein
MHYTYQNKANRDAKARELKAQGIEVIKRSMRGQQLHPMYVADYERELSESEKGPFNTIYKTYFPVLYIVETREIEKCWADYLY